MVTACAIKESYALFGVTLPFSNTRDNIKVVKSQQ